MRRTWLTAASLALVCVGCGSDTLISPRAPESSAGIAGPAPPAVAGVVRDDRGTPIAGATVWAAPGQINVISDANGRFVVPIGPNAGVWVWVFASKPGYESDAQQIAERVRDLTLHDVVRVEAGQSVRVTVQPNDPNLWIIDSRLLWEYDYRIRVVRLSAATASRVTVRLVADDGGPAEFIIRGHNGDPALVTMIGGSEVEVEIRVLAGSPSRTFTLTTSRSGVP